MYKSIDNNRRRRVLSIEIIIRKFRKKIKIDMIFIENNRIPC